MVATPSFPSFSDFQQRGIIKNILDDYDKKLPCYRVACLRICNDLSRERSQAVGFFTRIEGRLKSKDSIVQKLYSSLEELQQKGKECNDKCINEEREHILDILGIRLACKYVDQIKDLVGRVRDTIKNINGYSGDLRSNNEEYEDKDYLMEPDPKTGYRGYHFYVKVPVDNFYAEEEAKICEIQVRSDLQDVWARRSHELIYKKHGRAPQNKIERMKTLSNFVENLDDFLKQLKNEIVSS